MKFSYSLTEEASALTQSFLGQALINTLYASFINKIPCKEVSRFHGLQHAQAWSFFKQVLI